MQTLKEKVGLTISVLDMDIRKKDKEIQKAMKDPEASAEFIDNLIREKNAMIDEAAERGAAFGALRG